MIWIENFEDIYALLNVGCDKVSINSSAVAAWIPINEETQKVTVSQYYNWWRVQLKFTDGSYHVL